MSNKPFATTAEIKPGSYITLDNGFDCVDRHRFVRRIQEDKVGLYFPCQEGKHYLDGQLSTDETHYVGVYLTQTWKP